MFTRGYTPKIVILIGENDENPMDNIGALGQQHPHRDATPTLEIQRFSHHFLGISMIFQRFSYDFPEFSYYFSGECAFFFLFPWSRLKSVRMFVRNKSNTGQSFRNKFAKHLGSLRFAELKTCWLWTCTENAVAWHCYFQTYVWWFQQTF